MPERVGLSRRDFSLADAADTGGEDLVCAKVTKSTARVAVGCT